MTQNAHSMQPSKLHGKEPLMQTPPPLSIEEDKRLTAKLCNGQALTPGEEALMQAQKDWSAQQFLKALKAGVREGIETP